MTRLHVRRATRAAALLDEIVDSQLPLLAGLSEDSRRRSANYLAELVMLGQSYRHYAAGWIDHRELSRRSHAVVARLTEFRSPDPSTALHTERD